MENEKTNFDSSNRDNPKCQKNNGNLIGGLVLITLGILFLVDRFVSGVDFGDLWPIILVVAGVGLIINSFCKPKTHK